MELPEGLPLPAQVIFLIAAGVVYALVHFGVINGRKAPPEKQAGAAEIVALTVDSRSIEKLAGEAAGLAIAIGELRRAVLDGAQQISSSNDKLAEEVEKVATQLMINREVGRTRP